MNNDETCDKNNRGGLKINGNAPSLTTSIVFVCITRYRKTSVSFDKLKRAIKR
jgi:hypothetical protein